MTEVSSEEPTAHERTNRPGPAFESKLLSVCLGGSVIVVLSGLVQLRYGAYSMSFGEAWRALFDATVVLDHRWLLKFFTGEELMHAITGYEAGELPELSTATHIVWNIRLPRVLVAVLVGMNLAVSGAIFQAVTRNELASPYILGVSSGAGLMILLVLTVFSGLTAFLPLIASAGGAVAFLIVYVIAWNHGTSPVRLVLAGVIVGTVFGSFQTAMLVFTDDISVVQEAISWLNESLTGVNDYIAAYNLSSMTGEEWQTEAVEPLEEHPSASRLSAVQNGNVVRSAGQFMGPITHLFSTEALAKQVYPDRFGEWPGDSVDVPDDERLFDRERVANIVTGEL